MGVEFLRPEIGREIRIAPATAFVASDGNAALSSPRRSLDLPVKPNTEGPRLRSVLGAFALPTGNAQPRPGHRGYCPSGPSSRPLGGRA
jgi:hypothetical protein